MVFFCWYKIIRLQLTLGEDGADSVVANVNEVWSKHCILYIFVLVINFLVSTSYRKMWFCHLIKNRSQQPLSLEQKQRQFCSSPTFPNNFMMTDFYCHINFSSLAWNFKNLLCSGRLEVLIKKSEILRKTKPKVKNLSKFSC